MIRIQGIHKYFNKGRPNEIHVVNDISLELPDRGMVAVFGKSGCGKTTLLNVIGGLDSFSGGTLDIDGCDIRKDTDGIRNRAMGYIFQNYNLNRAETCFDNVADALRLCGMKDGPELEARVRAALACVDMAKYGQRTPDTLSGGQQQRIAIARSIVKNPKIILADEPTGNLDESNTLLIMDLLKQIAKDHLVLLVTHEADLVDYYCDTVIELKDGRVESIRQNENARGMVSRDKNHIYLGELEKTELSDACAHVAYYGDAPAAPLQLRVVNQNGKLYVQIDTAGVQVLDETSEIKLREGCFDPAPEELRATEHPIDMTPLPPLEGKDFGKLFRFGSSVKSGYRANFQKQKKGKKFLRACMCLFAAVVVLVSAAFGTAFRDLAEIGDSYSHNTFYVYTPDGAVSDTLMAAASQGKHGLSLAYLRANTPDGDEQVKFVTGYFETFSTASYDESFRTNAVFLPTQAMGDARLLAGASALGSAEEVIVTRGVADALLELSSVGYIDDYADLIAMVSAYAPVVDGEACRIVGVVEGDAREVYLSDAYFEEQAIGYMTNVFLAEDYRLSVAEGQVILAIRTRSNGTDYPTVGKTVTIHGKELTVARVMENPGDYESWMEETYGLPYDGFAYYRQEAEALHPDWDGSELGDLAYQLLADAGGNLPYWERYYSHIDEYIEQWRLFAEYDGLRWMYEEKGLPEAKYEIVGASDYYRYLKFEELYGRAFDETLEGEWERLDAIEPLWSVLEPYYKLFETEYYNFVVSENGVADQSVSFLLNAADRSALADCYGENHDLVMTRSTESEIVYYENGVIVDVYYDTVGGNSGVFGQKANMYTVLYSYDPDATAAWLEDEFSELEAPGNRQALITPDDLRAELLAEQGQEILTGFLTIGVLLALMSLCMYFIMRSVLLNRIKEVGIYRAIGVSRKNLCFRFWIEALVLATLTVFVGYLVSSAALFGLLSGSRLMASMMYYPLWMAGAVLAVLYGLCTLCGILPIFSLTRRSPAAILAKYDI